MPAGKQKNFDDETVEGKQGSDYRLSLTGILA